MTLEDSNTRLCCFGPIDSGNLACSDSPKQFFVKPFVNFEFTSGVQVRDLSMLKLLVSIPSSHACSTVRADATGEAPGRFAAHIAQVGVCRQIMATDGLPFQLPLLPR